MPKELFMRLPDSKKKLIYEVCLEEFNEYPFHEAKISHIVKKLNIARGSFYQYFQDLEDCYFYILTSEVEEIHSILIKLLKREDSTVNAMKQYLDILIDNLFDEKKYNLYKNLYLYWNPNLEKKLRKEDFKCDKSINISKIHIIKAVVHDLIYRMYVGRWNEEEFKQNYKEAIDLLRDGI